MLMIFWEISSSTGAHTTGLNIIAQACHWSEGISSPAGSQKDRNQGQGSYSSYVSPVKPPKSIQESIKLAESTMILIYHSLNVKQPTKSSWHLSILRLASFIKSISDLINCNTCVKEAIGRCYLCNWFDWSPVNNRSIYNWIQAFTVKKIHTVIQDLKWLRCRKLWIGTGTVFPAGCGSRFFLQEEARTLKGRHWP